MKQVLKYFSLLLISFTCLFTSCEDDDKDPVLRGDIAPFVKLITDNASYDIGDVNSAYEGTIFSDFPDVIDNHTISVAIDNSTNQNDFVDILTIEPSEMPFDLVITLQEVLDAFDLSLGDVEPGQRLIFRGRTIGVDGTIVDNSNTVDVAGSGNNNPGIRQAYENFAFISCPFVESEIIGTYDVITHVFDAFFGAQPPTREVVAGPGENQYTIIGGAIPLDGADDMIVTVNPATGTVSSGNPDDIHFNTFGPGVYGQVTGFTFSCVGFIDLTITSPGFISNTLTLQKQ